MADETLGHFQRVFTHFHDMRCAAHNTVATATIKAVFEGIKDNMGEEELTDVDLHLTLWLDTSMQTVYQDLWGTKEGTFRPANLVINHMNKTIHILKMTRGMDSNERGWRDKEHGKIAAYHALTLYLQA